VNVLVTGARGFLGGYVLESMRRTGHTIYATQRDQLDSDSEDYDVEWITMDLTQENHFSRLPARVDAVVHLAATIDRPGISLREYISRSTDMTYHLREYAIRAQSQSLVYASSVSVHGHVKESTLRPETPVRDPSPYGISKYLGERLLAEREDSVPSVALRLPGILGRGCANHWLSRSCRALARGQSIVVHNPDTLYNNVVSAAEVGRFVVSLLAQTLRGFRPLPLGAKTTIELKTLLEDVQSRLDIFSRIEWATNPTPSFQIDSTLAQFQFGYEPSGIVEQVLGYLAEDRLVCEPGPIS
jgi:nucleoside-diphosphate-sugar epimerase